MTIVPVARSLYLCDFHVGYSNGKVDLYGLFNALRPRDAYPYVRSQFCIFAQLTNGLGKVPFFVDIRFAESEQLIWASAIRELDFPKRQSLVQLALTSEGCRFEQPGLYIVELFCDNTWVCDTELLLR